MLRRLLFALAAAGLLLPAPARPQMLQAIVAASGCPSFVPTAGGVCATIFADFSTEGTTNHYYANGATQASEAAWLAALSGTFTRASTATDLLPTSASGASINTYSSNVARVIAGSGYLVEGARTNLFLQSAAPATQTITLGATGSYTLWVNGAGSATSSAGTATGTGYGAATNGTANTFNITGAGTVVITISGALNVAQLEAGAFGSSYIATTTGSVTRAADLLSIISTAFGASGTVLVGWQKSLDVSTDRLWNSNSNQPGWAVSGEIAPSGASGSNPQRAGLNNSILAWDGANFSSAMNGSLVSNNTAVVTGAKTLLGLGRFVTASTGQPYTSISTIAVWLNTRVANSGLTVLAP